MSPAHTIDATLSPADAARTRWDVLIVGAGPAGAMAAVELARRGVRVLLVDKAAFPRWKVCGCCLNGAALQTLHDAGLGELPARHGAPRLAHVRLLAGGRDALLPLPAGVALSRTRFDAALIRAAIRAGAHFLPRSHANWQNEDDAGVHVALRTAAGPREITARLVIAADGLLASFTRHLCGVRVVQATNSRLGAGTVARLPESIVPPGIIHMAIAPRGYVGLVRLEDDRVDIAAALEPGLVRDNGLAAAVCLLLDQAGFPVDGRLREAHYQGTPPLTRYCTPPRSERIFVVGDAARYVEPFTGEGMAWALAGSRAVVPFVLRALEREDRRIQRAWEQSRYARFSAGQWRCRLLTLALRRPVLAAFGIRVLARVPQLAAPYVRLLNRAHPTRGA